MDPYEVLGLDATASFDDAIAVHRRLTVSNNVIARRFTGQNASVRQRQLDWALKMLVPTMSTLVFVTPNEVIAACELMLESAVGQLSDLSDQPDWRGEGCS